MASIWNDIVLTWQGETYTVRPTLAFINHLEQGEGRSLSKMFVRLVSSDLPSSVACEIIAKTLNWAGCKNVTAEDVYSASNAGMSEQAITMASTILVGVMPKTEEKDGAKKKPVARRTLQSK